MPTPVTYSGAGPRITVNQMLKDPLAIRERMLRMADKQFIMEALLRRVPNTQSGVVAYNESTPLFADDDAAVVAEAAEIPLGQGQSGVPKAAFTVKTALGIEVTRETRDRNRMDLVTMRMTQVRNTFVKHWENRLFTALNAAVPAGNIVTISAGNEWDSATQTNVNIRQNILDAIEKVAEATVPGQGSDAYLGFVPDTIVMSTRVMYDLLLNDKFVKIYEQSPLAEKSPVYTGTLERQILGLNVLTSRFMNDDFVFVLESKTVGGYSDERPLQVSPTYPDNPREVWRSDVVRRTAIFVDQPLAIAKINNVKA